MDDFDGSAFGAALPWTALGVVLLLAITFLLGVRTGRHTVIDTAWGLGFVTVAGTAFALRQGDDLRAAVALTLTAIWGVRLAVHIGRRSAGRGEDPRYDELLGERSGNRNVVALRRVYAPQAVVLWLVSLPVQVAMFSDRGPGVLLWVGLAVWGVGLFFEAVGDWQLQRFRDDPASKGAVLDTGLWRYTRHPNYFGDACVWWGLWLVAADTGLPGWLTVLSPVLMTWLLAKGTGKPLLERNIVERRPLYAAYVENTSGFFPLPPRRRTQ